MLTDVDHPIGSDEYLTDCLEFADATLSRVAATVIKDLVEYVQYLHDELRILTGE